MTTPLIPFAQNCLLGNFIRREKRFFIHFEHNGVPLVAHTNNSGSMLGLLRPYAPVLVSCANNPKRKLQYTLELISNDAKACVQGFPLASVPIASWVGVNTSIPNKILKAAFFAGLLPFTRGYTNFKAEAVIGNSRIDGLLTAEGLPQLYVECKNVSLVEDGVAAFPDAVTVRGQKHLKDLVSIVQQGGRAAMLYCVQRSDAACFAPAEYVDPQYAQLFYEALDAGVEAYPFALSATPSGISLKSPLPVQRLTC